LINLKQELPVAAMFLTNRDEMRNIYRESSIDTSYQVSVHLVKWFQRRRYLEIDHSETKIACGGQVY
jgi:hypothetical protein